MGRFPKTCIILPDVESLCGQSLGSMYFQKNFPMFLILLSQIRPKLMLFCIVLEQRVLLSTFPKRPLRVLLSGLDRPMLTTETPCRATSAGTALSKPSWGGCCV